MIVDLHTHILPGLDDGARDLEASLEIARAAVAEGVAAMVGTPHFRSDYPTSAAQRDNARALLQQALDTSGIPLMIHAGAEIALDYLDSLTEESLESLCLGSGRVLLIESPYDTWPLGTQYALGQLKRRGFGILIAHPERNDEVRRSVEFLREYAEWGVMFQITAASLAGKAGRDAHNVAHGLIDAGLAHVIASDAHGHPARPISFERARENLDDDPLFHWMSEGVPEAILLGEEIPPQPARRKHRRFLGRRR